jgi:hypothetical protein
MKKEFTILLVGLVTGVGIMHLLDTDPVQAVQCDMANNEQLTMTATEVVGHSRRDDNAPTREKTNREDFIAQHQGKLDSTTSAMQMDPYQATALQLARITDNMQWAQSFQGNYSEAADAANTQLIQLGDTLTHQFGSYYSSGCNEQFCAMLAQGFTDRQQAETAVEKMLNSKQLPNFKYYRIIEDKTGIALRFSIPIDQHYAPTNSDLKAFSNKFKSLSPEGITSSL